MVNQNMKIIEDLISEGETNITSKNSKYLDAIKALRPINEDKTDVLFKLGFGFSRRFHPIAFHHAIKLYLFEGKEDQVMDDFIRPMNSFFSRFLQGLDQGDVKDRETFEKRRKDVDEFYSSFWLTRKAALGEEQEEIQAKNVDQIVNEDTEEDKEADGEVDLNEEEGVTAQENVDGQIDQRKEGEINQDVQQHEVTSQ